MIDHAPLPDAASLIAAARSAATRAYAPYSNFLVGAAIALDDGTIVTGANVENASYGLSLCAETVAIAAVANRGRLGDVVAVAVVGASSEAPITPCGRCRQVLNEAASLGGRDLPVYCAGAGEDIVEHRLSTLLPYAFGPRSL